MALSKQAFESRTAEQKADHVASKVAYWPKSVLARFSEMETQNNKMFEILIKLSDSNKIDISDILTDPVVKE